VARHWVNALGLSNYPGGVTIVDFGVDLSEEEGLCRELFSAFPREQGRNQRLSGVRGKRDNAECLRAAKLEGMRNCRAGCRLSTGPARRKL
jgi:hypothetical protein